METTNLVRRTMVKFCHNFQKYLASFRVIECYLLFIPDRFDALLSDGRTASIQIERTQSMAVSTQTVTGAAKVEMYWAGL